MKLYGIPNCNTVKKARDWLEQHSVAYDFHDLKKLGIDEATLNHWLAQVSWEQLVNRAGLTWRGLDETTKANVKDNASATRLMQEKTSVIKRPVLADNDQILCLGFHEPTYRKHLTK